MDTPNAFTSLFKLCKSSFPEGCTLLTIEHDKGMYVKKRPAGKSMAIRGVRACMGVRQQGWVFAFHWQR